MRAPGGAGGRPPASKQWLTPQHEAGAARPAAVAFPKGRADRSADCCDGSATKASERSEQRAARPRPRAAHAPPVGWQPGLRRGQPSAVQCSGRAAAARLGAALTGPPPAALTARRYQCGQRASGPRDASAGSCSRASRSGAAWRPCACEPGPAAAARGTAAPATARHPMSGPPAASRLALLSFSSLKYALVYCTCVQYSQCYCLSYS